jgi:hypothetical protein
VQDAIEWFEAPGVLPIGLGGYLQGAFVVGSQKNAGHRRGRRLQRPEPGMNHPAAAAVFVRLAFRLEPISRVTARRGQVGLDQGLMFQDVFHFFFIHPHAQAAAGALAFVELAALHRLGLK